MIKELFTHYYLVIKALHIIAIISWMAGLLYLPRLFVYHSQVLQKSEMDSTFKIMEFRLLKYIINPSMILSIITGTCLIIIKGFEGNYSLHAKLLLVFFLLASHGLMAKHRKQFKNGTNNQSHIYFRVLNEVPTVLMILIVFIVVLKPFN